MKTLVAYYRLLRFPLVFTAVANILAGYFLAHGPGEIEIGRLLLAVLSSALLYTGGMILNDVFDAPRDKARGRDRPIPSGRIRRDLAAALGFGHLILGVAAAMPLGRETAGWAALCAVAVLLYDGVARHPAWLGVTMMSLSRVANVLIGIGAGGGIQAAWTLGWFDGSPGSGMNHPGEVWLYPFAVFAYTAAVTVESLREDHHGRKPLMRLPFDFAYYAIPAAIFGSLMCDDHSPFAQIFWVFPVLMALADGRAYAARPSLLAARRTVRDGLLCFPCLDAIVVTTVLAVQSRLVAVFAGIAVASLGALSYLMMRLSTPAGQTPTADDEIAARNEDSGVPPGIARFHIEERSTNHRAVEDGTFTPGGTWHVLRCQIPARAPARFLLGVSEIDPESPTQVTVRIRPQDPASARGLVEALAQVVELAVPTHFPTGGPGWVDIRGRLIAAGIARTSPGQLGEMEPGDWDLYECKWSPPLGGRKLTLHLGINEITGLGEISSPGLGHAEESWNSLIAELVPPQNEADTGASS